MKPIREQRRIYQQNKRARQQEQTRRRIVEATVGLHQSIGGPAATVSAIAQAAGVERATVYRHFPDERSLLQACTSHYLQQNPPPDAEAWRQYPNPAERMALALDAIYTYHAENQVMLARAEIDVVQMPVLREVLAPMFAYWAGVVDILAEPWSAEGSNSEFKVLRGLIGHAVAFGTWQSLVRAQGLTHEAAVVAMVRLVECNAD